MSLLIRSRRPRAHGPNRLQDSVGEQGEADSPIAEHLLGRHIAHAGPHRLMQVGKFFHLHGQLQPLQQPGIRGELTLHTADTVNVADGRAPRPAIRHPHRCRPATISGCKLDQRAKKTS